MPRGGGSNDEVELVVGDLADLTETAIGMLSSPEGMGANPACIQRNKLQCRIKELQINAGKGVDVREGELVQDNRLLWQKLVGNLTRLTTKIGGLGKQASELATKMNTLDTHITNFSRELSAKHEETKNSATRKVLKILGVLTGIAGIVLGTHELARPVALESLLRLCWC
jgi:hypothetical protein